MPFLSCMPSFSSLALLEVHQEFGHTWRTLVFLAGVENDLVNLAVLDHLGTPSKNCLESFVKIQLDLAEIRDLKMFICLFVCL